MWASLSRTTGRPTACAMDARRGAGPRGPRSPPRGPSGHRGRGARGCRCRPPRPRRPGAARTERRTSSGSSGLRVGPHLERSHVSWPSARDPCGTHVGAADVDPDGDASARRVGLRSSAVACLGATPRRGRPASPAAAGTATSRSRVRGRRHGRRAGSPSRASGRRWRPDAPPCERGPQVPEEGGMVHAAPRARPTGCRRASAVTAAQPSSEPGYWSFIIWAPHARAMAAACTTSSGAAAW